MTGSTGATGATGATGFGAIIQNNGTTLTQRTTVNFTGNLQAVDTGARIDVSLKPDVSGLTSLGIANASATAANFTSTANGNFTTGAGTGFYYGGATGSQVGANTISSSGAFTGTLLALTADSTQTGTILGISGQGLVSGKAIDVSLGLAYNLAGGDSTGQQAGAVNVRAGAYNGNIFNVLSTANAGAATMNLANLESGQTDGQLLNLKTNGIYTGLSGTSGILNINANTATGGTIARISATSLTGASQGLSILLGASKSATGILVNTGVTYAGNLIDLQANSVSQFKVDANNTTVAGGLLGSNGTAFSIDETGSRPINIGGTNASLVNLGHTGISTNSVGQFTVGTTALVVSAVSGNVTAQGIGTFGPTLGNQLTIQGAASGTGVKLQATASSDPNVAISLAPVGTGRVKVIGATGGLDVDGDILAGTALANRVQLVGGASTVPVSVNATGLDADITLQLAAKGVGTVRVTGSSGLTGPTAAAFVIDAGGAQTINIGGTAGTTLNLGRATQLQALLGNATVAGTFGVTGNFSVNTTRFTVAALTGNTVINGTLVGNNATGFLIDASGTQPISIGTGAGTSAVTIGKSGALTTIAGNGQVNGTFKVASTGTALNEIRFGTCAIVSTSVPLGGAGSATTNCTITGGVQNLQAYQVSVTPGSALPAGLAYSVGFPSTTQIVMQWVNSTGAAVFTGAITFKWTAVR